MVTIEQAVLTDTRKEFFRQIASSGGERYGNLTRNIGNIGVSIGSRSLDLNRDNIDDISFSGEVDELGLPEVDISQEFGNLGLNLFLIEGDVDYSVEFSSLKVIKKIAFEGLLRSLIWAHGGSSYGNVQVVHSDIAGDSIRGTDPMSKEERTNRVLDLLASQNGKSETDIVISDFLGFEFPKDFDPVRRAIAIKLNLPYELEIRPEQGESWGTIYLGKELGRVNTRKKKELDRINPILEETNRERVLELSRLGFVVIESRITNNPQTGLLDMPYIDQAIAEAVKSIKI